MNISKDIILNDKNKNEMKKVGEQVVEILVVETGKWITNKIKNIFENPSERIKIHSQVRDALANPTKYNRKQLMDLNKTCSYFRYRSFPSTTRLLIPVYGLGIFASSIIEGKLLVEGDANIKRLIAKRDYVEYKSLVNSEDFKGKYFDGSELEIEQFRKVILSGKKNTAEKLARIYFSYKLDTLVYYHLRPKNLDIDSIVKDFHESVSERVDYELSTLRDNHFPLEQKSN